MAHNIEAQPIRGEEVVPAGKRLPRRVQTAIAVAVAVYHLLYISMVLPRLGIHIMEQQHRAISLGSFLLLAFLIWPARKGRTSSRIPWYDFLLILASIIPTGYYAIFYDSVLGHILMGTASTAEIIFAFLLVVAILEAGRRVVGWAMPIVVLFFIVHLFFAEHFPGILLARALSLQAIANMIYLSSQGILGIPVGIASTVIVAYILFSQLFINSGAAKFLFNLAFAMVGTMRGGPAKVAVVASAFFAMLSGSASANVAADGCITIPLMKKTGYPAYFAGAVEAVASNGGAITPPVMGAVVFIMADITGYSYTDICIAAALPALLYFIAVFLQVDFRAARIGLRGLSRAELPSLKQTLKEGWYYVIPVVVLVVLLGLRYEPELAAIYTMVVVWIISLFRKETRLGPRRLVEGFETSVSMTLYAAIPCAMSGIILASLSATGLGLRFSSHITDLASGSMLALMVLASIASFVMGMGGLGTIAIYVILVVMIAPGMIEMGVSVMAAHLFIIFWGNTTFISPPVAVAAFIAAGIAQAPAMKTAWAACRLGIVSFLVPFMFVWSPSLLMIGSAKDVLLAVPTALVGTALLACGVEGYLPGGGIKWPSRVLLIVGGIGMMVPGWQTDVIGLIIILPPVLWRVRRLLLSRRGKSMPV